MKRFLVTLGAIGVGLAAVAASTSCSAADGAAAVCHAKVQAPQRCRWVTGLVRLTNGTPSIRVLPHGEHRRYGVWPPENEWMPADLKSQLTFDNEISARMRLCPNPEKLPPGAMRDVCIDDATVLKVLPRGR
ncbi:MAG TPA: hypothetical protein VF457_09250 [Burkholderiaceae bacterium]